MDFPWTARQRGTLAVLMLGVLALVAFLAWRNPVWIANPQTGPGDRAAELQSRIDPNTADWPALAAIPGVGKALAQRIVEEREQFKVRHPAQLAYRSIEDLKRVKGIGDVTAESLEPYLLFPALPAATPRSR